MEIKKNIYKKKFHGENFFYRKFNFVGYFFVVGFLLGDIWY